MLVSVIPIGNSKGIRLPKSILGQLQNPYTLELEVENQQIILRPIKKAPRQGWQEAFINMHEEHQDTLLVPDQIDNEAFEWEW
jgi:antitoxin MazE